MRNTILISLLLMFLPVSVSAQFYTITRDSELLPTERQKEAYIHAGKDVTEGKKNKIMANDTRLSDRIIKRIWKIIAGIVTGKYP